MCAPKYSLQQHSFPHSVYSGQRLSVPGCILILLSLMLELRNEGRGTPKTPKGEHKHLMTTAEVQSTTVSCI